MSADSEHRSAPARASLSELFLAFAKVAVSGFGGALPWARRMLVERKQWVTSDEFNELFALSQFLPGPNVVNLSVVFGQRYAGARGALVAFAGLMSPPLVIVIVLAMLYARYGELEMLGRALTGMTAAAAGLLIAVAVKMTVPLFTRGWSSAPAIALAAFAGVAVMHWPLPAVFAVLAPISFVFAWFRK